jgi:hypothetical protein
MNNFCRLNSLNHAKLVTAIAATLTLNTTGADAAKRQVGTAPRFAAQGGKVVPIHAAPEQSYWMYRRCSPAARAAEDAGTKTLKYLYDFGDGWKHTIKVERLIDRNQASFILG